MMQSEADGMTAKEYLQQVRKKEAIISRLYYDKKNLHEMLYSIGGIQEGEKVQTSLNPDKFGSIYAKIAEKEDMIAKKIEELIDFKMKVADEISMLSNPKYVEILHKRYIQFFSFEQIAVDMGYSYRYIVKIHGYALQEFDKIRKSNRCRVNKVPMKVNK